MPRYDTNALAAQNIFDLIIPEAYNYGGSSAFGIISDLFDRLDEIKLTSRAELKTKRKQLNVGEITKLRHLVVMIDIYTVIIDGLKTVVINSHKADAINNGDGIKSMVYLTNELNMLSVMYGEHKRNIVSHLDHGICKRFIHNTWSMF